MNYNAIDINEKFESFNDHWSPKIIGSLNNYYIKLAKIEGHFTWHKHEDTDEIFIVNRGSMRIDFRDGNVELKQGQMFIVEKGKEHKPYAEKECEIMIFEPNTTLNTGDVKDSFTKEKLEWI